MITFIVLVGVALYLTAAVVYARRSLAERYAEGVRAFTKRHKILMTRDSPYRAGYLRQIRREALCTGLLLGCVWPVFIPALLVHRLLISPIYGWMVAPITERERRADQLRKDAATWKLAFSEGTPAEQRMAKELERLCREQADALDF